jgi:hypothetical protein
MLPKDFMLLTIFVNFGPFSFHEGMRIIHQSVAGVFRERDRRDAIILQLLESFFLALTCL